MNTASYIRAAKEKKAARALVRKYAPKREMDIHEIIARNQLMEKQFSEYEEVETVEQGIPHMAKNVEVLNQTSQSAASRRIREEDSVSATLMKRYLQGDKEALG